ncbi:hypothetical protein NW755_010262 [Fusarium falciforme]|uniref:LIM zinc-binding domain-containing protein n=1 Tax=Fusarium falciforme TaxID=195108 RepID=A0A9W8R2B9_9HYPO|nr:hypothetical protein NW755_010262 [Fusarium falciforme]
MEAQSIFDNENTRLSLFDMGAISAVAPSELDFDFDDLVLNSQAYRRAFARAQSNADLETQAHVTEDIGLHLSDGATIRRVNQDLVGLNLATIVESSSPRSISTILERQESVPEEPDNPPPQQQEEITSVRDGTDLPAKELPNQSQLASCSERTCGKCSRTISCQFVKEQGETFHPDCFTCVDCGESIETKFFPLKDHPGAQICEKDYFRRLGLLCHDCGQGLVGAYITSGDKKYHLEHFKRDISSVTVHAVDGSHGGELLNDKENDAQVYGK